jgi:hypothetical protein
VSRLVPAGQAESQGMRCNPEDREGGGDGRTRDAWVHESGEHRCRGHIRRNDIFVMI